MLPEAADGRKAEAVGDTNERGERMKAREEEGQPTELTQTDGRTAWLPDGYNKIFRLYVFGPLGL